MNDTPLLVDVAREVARYIDDARTGNGPVSARRGPEEVRQHLGVGLDEEGQGLDALPDLVRRYLDVAVKTASPRFANQLFGGASIPGIAGELVAAASNTSMYTYEVAPAGTLIEGEVLGRMRELVGFVRGEGILVTGGSNANLVALLAARALALPGAREHGLFGEAPLAAFVSEDAHYSYRTAAQVSGLGMKNLVAVACDDFGRMRKDALVAAIAKARDEGKRPFFIGATAGTTVKGAFDPIDALADVAEAEGLWLHVDGAWGGAAALSPRTRPLLEGSARASSFSWDAHKMMGMPLVCSAILFRERGHLLRLAQHEGAEYLFHDESPDDADLDLGKRSLQCGRRVDALKLWLAWKCVGDAGFRAHVETLMDLAAHAESVIAGSDRFELAAPRAYTNLCFRVLPRSPLPEDLVDAMNLEARAMLAARGEALINHARVDGRPIIRLALSNSALTPAELDAMLDGLRGAFDELERAVHERGRGVDATERTAP